MIKPVLRYPGGKTRLAPWIIEQMPPHSVCVEPFFGGGSVLFSKERVPGENAPSSWHSSNAVVKH